MTKLGWSCEKMSEVLLQRITDYQIFSLTTLLTKCHDNIADYRIVVWPIVYFVKTLKLLKMP